MSVNPFINTRWRIVALVGALTCLFAAVMPAGSAESSAQSGFKLYQAQKFSAALPFLKAANRQSPRDFAILYYLGDAAYRTGDTNLAIDAFSRLFVISAGISKFTAPAEPIWSRIRGSSHPYSCQVGNTVVRWHPKCMPIRIYFTDGKELPDNLGSQNAISESLKTYGRSFHSLPYLTGLSTAGGYSPGLKAAALQGLNQWSWLAGEKILNYTVVEDPTHADILVFWSSKMIGRNGLTTYPPSEGVRYPLASVRGCPVVVQLSTKSNSTSLSRTACHEFGHAFGLQHSPNPNDVMYEKLNPDTRVSNSLSDSDQLTIRALYRVPADVYLVSN